MKNLLEQLFAARLAKRPAALCRLIETRGSTPRKAGAAMLAFADGSQAGTLGGGCVEAEVKRRAIAAIEKRAAETARFELDHDYGWDDGLICGGRMTVLLDPLADAEAAAYYEKLSELLPAGVTEIVAMDAEKCGCAAGACLLLDAEGRIAASLRVESPEGLREKAAVHLRPLDQRPRAYAAEGFAFLPTLPRCPLVIVGGGHVGRQLGALAVDLDFDLTVVDDREDFASAERFPLALQRLAGPITPTLDNLEITPQTYCVIVTRGHRHDLEALHRLVERGARYVGLIGSRRKIKLIFDDLLDRGVSPDALRGVFAPLGIDIGSQTVMEIAVSIAAELVSHRNRGGMVPGRPRGVDVGDATRK
jgi:xanthine dehydrogenase accessory factor